jgi:glycosyltransferase involved in cell wall biosynthesis
LKIVCIPAFNAEKTVGDVIKKSLKHVDKVIVCDDGSTDDTNNIAKKSGALVITHEKNQGYGEAIISLFDATRKENADVMITLDSDGQHNPDEIPLLIKKLAEKNLDVVIGSRFLDGNSKPSGFRKTGINMITSASNLGTSFKVTDSQSGFRAYSKRAIQEIRPTEKGMGISTEILQKISNKGLTIGEVPVTIVYGEGTSTQNPIKHGSSVFITTLRYVSVVHPLAFYGIPGIILMIIGSVFGYTFLHAYLHNQGIYLGSLGAGILLFALGTILCVTAIILFTLSTLIKTRE